MTRLLSAIDVYGGLGLVNTIREDVIRKLVGMLTHPFPRVSSLYVSIVDLMADSL